MAILSQGDNAPDFTLPASAGKECSLSSYKGKNVVIYFYPKDNTPGCTKESKDFRDLKAEFDGADTEIIGISKDSVKSHDSFCAKYDLPFILASDAEGEACEKYGVWKEKSMFGKKYMGIERSTFLIDKNGVIANIWYKVSVTGHAQKVLNEAKKLAG